MDVEYLKANVGETLATGLAQVVLSNPTDSVDFLAKWLLNYVDNVKAEATAAEALALQIKADEDAEDARLTQLENEEKKRNAGVQAEKKKHSTVGGFLKSVSENENLLEQYVNLMFEHVGCAGVYAGKLLPEGEIQYIAVSKTQEFILGQKLGKGEGDDEEAKIPITFNLFEEEEPVEEVEDDDPDNPLPKVPPVPTIKSVSVPNVLMGQGAENMHFWKLPQMGAYYAVKVDYKTSLTDDLLNQAAAYEDEIEADERAKLQQQLDDNDDQDSPADELTPGSELLSPEQKAENDQAEADAKQEAREVLLLSKLKLKDVTYAIGFDTLGQTKRFTVNQIKFINKYGLELIDTLERLDKELFKAERKRRRELKKFTIQWNERRSSHEEDEEESIAKLQKQNKPFTTEDIKFNNRQTLLTTSLKRTLLEQKQFEVLHGPIAVLEAFLLLIGIDGESLKFLGETNWYKVRALLNEELLVKVKAHNPRAGIGEETPAAEGKKDNEAESKVEKESSETPAVDVSGLIEGINIEELKETNAVLAELLGFVQDSIILKAKAKQEAADERQRIQEEAELAAQLQKEEEDRLAAQKEQDEADAAAAAAGEDE